MKERDLSFPLKLKNNVGRVHYVGSIRFGPGEVKKVSALVYSRNKKLFDEILNSEISEGVFALEIIASEKTTEVTETNKEPKDNLDESSNDDLDETKTKDSTDVDENEESPEEKAESIILQYSKNKINWSQTTREIKSLKNIDEVRALHKEGLELGLDEDSAVMKALLSSIRALGSFV